ncbi:MAG: dockerin type I repeat-containing protein, partial [Candidatus Omnitrophica bacterium]|nr:dockerin type I repeat-containing protein [Candidatus Omnitrophota bacterium]
MMKNKVCSKRLWMLVYGLCFIVSLPSGLILADEPIGVGRTEDGKFIPTIAYDPAKQGTEKPVLTNIPELTDPSGCLTPVEKPAVIESQPMLTAAEKQSVETLYANLDEKRVAYLSVEETILMRATEAADVNNDGTINAIDLFMLQERLMQESTASQTAQDRSRMDIDLDGELTVKDLDLIHRAIDSQERYVPDANGKVTIDGQDWYIQDRQREIAEQEKRRKELEKAFWDIGQQPGNLNGDDKLDDYDLREAIERKKAEEDAESHARGTEMEQPAGPDELFWVGVVVPGSPLSPGYPSPMADNYLSPFDDSHSDDQELMPVSYTKTPVNAGAGSNSIFANWLNQLDGENNAPFGQQQFMLATGVRNDSPTLWQLLEIFIDNLRELLAKKNSESSYKQDAGLLGALQTDQKIVFSSNALELTYGYINEFNSHSKRRANANSNVVVVSPALLALWAVLNESNQEHPFQRVLDLWRVGPEGVKALYVAQARIDDLNQRVKARKGFIRYNNERRAFN